MVENKNFSGKVKVTSLLDVILEWFDFITVSELRRDLRLPEEGGLPLKRFDQKYPMLKGWGYYMYTHSDKRKIVYIGETGRKGPRSFRQRLRERILSSTTPFCSELSALGINIDSLYLKVASIKRVIDKGRMMNEVDWTLLRRIEMALTCATDPVYDPHGPTHAKEDFEIHNTGNPSPLHELLKMMKGQECMSLDI